MRFQDISNPCPIENRKPRGKEEKSLLRTPKAHAAALVFPSEMVQRKVANKLGIHADQVKTNKLLENLKPSSFQHLDAKNKGTDLKKKMKKSRPTKRSDLERLGSPNIRRQVPQPGKPPPPLTPVFASPQKKYPVKASETTPNYMKATSSSDARKERSQVSSRNLQTLFDGKSSSRKDSNSMKISSGSVHKAARALARTSSSKLVRTLTKTTSFKPARTSAKKCSPLVLTENLDIQRATCSSTLKDSNFPAFLELSSGATEVEGTSVTKVCPYTYCSLNGHHHPPLPPLKSFLSTRRRMLKTQRSFKLGCLSPRRSKPISTSKEEIQVEETNFDEKSPNQDPLNSSMTSSTDFFIQIYSKERETTADITDSTVDGLTGGDETAAQDDYRQVLEIFSGESAFSEIDSLDDSSENVDSVSSDMEAEEYSEEVDQNKDAEQEVYCPLRAEENLKLGSLCWSDGKVESSAIIPEDNPEFGPSDMDCEAENYSTMYLDYEAENSLQRGKDSDLEGDSDEFGSCIIPEESIFKSGIENRCFGEIQAGVALHQSSDEESFDKESVSSKAGSYPDYQIEDYVEGPDNESHDQSGLQVEDESIYPLKTEHLIGEYKHEFARCDDAAGQEWDLDLQDFHDMNEESSNQECEGSIGSKDVIGCYQYDNNSNTSCFNCEALNGSIPTNEKDSESKNNSFELKLATDAGDAMEENGPVDPVQALFRIEICISLQGSTEIMKDKSIEDLDNNHLETIEMEGKSDQNLSGMDLMDGTQDHSADEKSISSYNETLNSLEDIEAANSKATVSTDLGEEISPTPKDPSGIRTKNIYQGCHSNQELAESCKTLNWKAGCKRSIEEFNDPKEFNPREPNFLPVEPDPEAEKVDLKHQMMDERKNADEWMLDYAIQKAVNKLAPARKKKVALLVEAFETVMPVPRYDTQHRHSSLPFNDARPIQACS